MFPNKQKKEKIKSEILSGLALALLQRAVNTAINKSLSELLVVSRK